MITPSEFYCSSYVRLMKIFLSAQLRTTCHAETKFNSKQMSLTQRRKAPISSTQPPQEEPKLVKPEIHYGCWCSMNKFEKGKDYIPTTAEQIANTLTHGIPALAAFVALIFMLLYIVDSPMEAFVAWIYGTCMILLFSVSTLYHLFTLTHTMNHKLAQFFRTFDHAVIYIFIAASYTPYVCNFKYLMFLGG
jgi:hypothetical protein